MKSSLRRRKGGKHADEDGGFATAGNLIAGVERLHPALTLPLLPPSISLPSPLPSLFQSPSQALPSFGRNGCVGMGVSGGGHYAKAWGSYPDLLQNSSGVGSWVHVTRYFLKLLECALWGLWRLRGYGVHALICWRMQLRLVLKEGQAVTQRPPSF